MGFLKRIFGSTRHEETPPPADVSSFDHLTEEELETHLRVARYGKFTLTQAVRPSYDLRVVPRQGYRYDRYRDEQTRATIPVLMAAASAERLFDLFLDLIDPLGTEVDVVVETSHDRDHSGHLDLYREHIDLPVLKSLLYDYEDLLLNDGCTGIAVLNPAIPQEVQFDEHKLLIVYGQPLTDYERVLRHYGLSRYDDLQFITEAEHVHSSSEEFAADFAEMRRQLGIDETY